MERQDQIVVAEHTRLHKQFIVIIADLWLVVVTYILMAVEHVVESSTYTASQTSEHFGVPIHPERLQAQAVVQHNSI